MVLKLLSGCNLAGMLGWRISSKFINNPLLLREDCQSLFLFYLAA
jgi:hypothetical protein